MFGEKFSFNCSTLFVIASILITFLLINQVESKEEEFKDNDYNPMVDDDQESEVESDLEEKNGTKGVPQNMFFLATSAASKMMKHLSQLQHQLIEWIVNVILPKAFNIHIPKYQVQEVITFIKNWTWNKLKTTGLLNDYLWVLDTLSLFQDNSIV